MARRIALVLPFVAATAAAQPAEAPPAAPEAPAAAQEAPAATPPAAAEAPATPAAPESPAAAPEASPAPSAPATPAAPALPEGTTAPVAEAAAPDEAPDARLGDIAIELSGYIRSQYTAIQDDPNVDFVGRNDGFVLQNARFILDANEGDVSARLSVEGALDRRERNNTASGSVEVRLRDAYVAYEPLPYLRVRTGQFKPPFDGEELQSTRDLLFVERAVESRGVSGVEGINIEGLSLPRQVGAMLYSEPLMLRSMPLGFAYFLSATNGVAAEQPVNDNDSLAYTGRIEAYFSDLVTLGGGVYFNELTTGEPPDLSRDERFGIAADLRVEAYGALFYAQYLRVSTKLADVPSQPERVAHGFHVQLGYEAPLGLVPSYRYAFYDPFAEFESDDTSLELFKLQYHTLGLGWLVPGQPLKVQANYTLTLEEEGRELENDRLDVLVQASF